MKNRFFDRITDLIIENGLTALAIIYLLIAVNHLGLF